MKTIIQFGALATMLQLFACTEVEDLDDSLIVADTEFDAETEDDFHGEVETLADSSIDEIMTPEPESEFVSYCEASCGSDGTISCSGTFCSAVDRNCNSGQRGSVTCDGETAVCASPCGGSGGGGCAASSLCGYIH